MFEHIEMIRMARAMTGHAAQRNVVVARNIANADTPGFKARDLKAFEDTYRSGNALPLRISRAGHLTTPALSQSNLQKISAGGIASPNGNSVSLEEELVKTAELKRQHDLSLGIYRSALDLMRTSIGRHR